jgi:hypothetical protein
MQKFRGELTMLDGGKSAGGSYDGDYAPAPAGKPPIDDDIPF